MKNYYQEDRERVEKKSLEEKKKMDIKLRTL